jgi:glycogen operon protein
VVVDDAFDWRGDEPPRIPWHETVIYEAHVKGLTRLHPDVPPELRGKYPGVAHPAIIQHLKSLGVTAIELLPIHEFADDLFLQERGLTELLGLQLHQLLRAGRAVRARPRLRRAGEGVQGDGAAAARGGDRGDPGRGLQPHAEGHHLGPTLSFKGIDNPTYYRLVPHNRRFYMDYTGRGTRSTSATRRRCRW